MQYPNLVIPQHPMSGSASGPSPSPRALDWCKKIQCIQQEKMTPEQRQHVLQAAERHREILQCQVVSSEVQKRMKDVQVQPPSPSAQFAFLSPFLTFDASVCCKQSLPLFFRPTFGPSICSCGLCYVLRPPPWPPPSIPGSDGLRSF